MKDGSKISELADDLPREVSVVGIAVVRGHLLLCSAAEEPGSDLFFLVILCDVRQPERVILDVVDETKLVDEVSSGVVDEQARNVIREGRERGVNRLPCERVLSEKHELRSNGLKPCLYKVEVFVVKVNELLSSIGVTLCRSTAGLEKHGERVSDQNALKWSTNFTPLKYCFNRLC